MNNMKVTKISAITLPVSDMKKSVDFYSKIPNFKMVYGGPDSQFTSFLIEDAAKSYLNLKLNEKHSTGSGRIIFMLMMLMSFLLTWKTMR